MKERRRSQRFQMVLPVSLVRHGGSIVNKAGETRNLSSSGVYFVVGEVVKVGSSLEYVITVPEEIQKGRRLWILCRGRVKRVERQEEALVGVAATVERYEFLQTPPN